MGDIALLLGFLSNDDRYRYKEVMVGISASAPIIRESHLNQQRFYHIALLLVSQFVGIHVENCDTVVVKSVFK